MKKLSELALNITESEYRAINAKSYSMLSKLSRDGPMSIIDDKKEENDIMVFGSLIDCILTDNENIFNRFKVIDFEKISEKTRGIVDKIFNEYLYGVDIDELSKIERSIVDEILIKEEYYSNYKPDTKYNKFIEDASQYYSITYQNLFLPQKIITRNMYEDAINVVSTIKNNKFTAPILNTDNGSEIYYQLKFISFYDDLPIKCMFDIIRVDHVNKMIYPLDLKIKVDAETNFLKTYYHFRYDIQSKIYCYILNEILKKDDYYKDFTIRPFSFIVVNRFKPKPIIWVDRTCFLTTVSDKQKEYGVKSWIELLQDYIWHEKTGVYDYAKEVYINNGIKYIE